ncbi:putative uncharacterized protein [Oscillibacter sp. CAG:155]|nr:putative uncharacterized protein [Oscillibacter sp. CAG:155]
MDLVHNINPLFHIGRGIDGLIPQRPHLIHAIIGGGVQLQYIQEAAVFDPLAAGTLAAGVPIHRMLTVDSLGQDFGTGGLSGSPGAGKQVGMRGPPLRHLLFQGLGDMGLADDIRKRLGPPFAVQRLVHDTPPGKKTKSSVCSCGTGALAAHGTSRLMLLGSPPDMVRGHPLRETGSAAACGGLFHSLFILLYAVKFINQKFLLSRKKYALQRENLWYNIICR